MDRPTIAVRKWGGTVRALGGPAGRVVAGPIPMRQRGVRQRPNRVIVVLLGQGFEVLARLGLVGLSAGPIAGGAAGCGAIRVSVGVDGV